LLKRREGVIVVSLRRNDRGVTKEWPARRETNAQLDSERSFAEPAVADEQVHGPPAKKAID
jgi:hypothetical protein